MAKVETFKCDVCGKQKQETNHWFLMTYVIGGIGAGMHVSRWDDASPELPATKHLCGQACVISALSDWMGQN